VDETTAALQALWRALQKDLMDVQKEVSNSWKEVAKLCNYLSGQDEIPCQPSSVCQPVIHVPETPAIPESASSTSAALETNAPAQSPSSAISNVSSSSSSFHINSLLLNSPHTQPTGLPVAGPSGTRREQVQVHSTFCNRNVMLDKLITLAYCNYSVRPHASERFRARGDSSQATI
jgi:hypothetical protein